MTYQFNVTTNARREGDKWIADTTVHMLPATLREIAEKMEALGPGVGVVLTGNTGNLSFMWGGTPALIASKAQARN